MTHIVSTGKAGGIPNDAGWIDVSVPIRSGMVHWPDDPEVEIERVADMADGYVCNLSQICIGAHVGTHVDAPLHLLPEGLPIDRMPLEATVGAARVIEIASPRAIEVRELRDKDIQPGERILFKTINSRRCWGSDRFFEDYVGVWPEAAEYLVERKVRTVGSDYLSIGPYGPVGEQTHQVLLRGDLGDRGPGPIRGGGRRV